jgi:hypothetical protein
MKIDKQKKHICLTKWKHRISDAEKRGEFTKDEAGMAGTWDACAVGEGRSKLKKSLAMNDKLFNLDWCYSPRNYILKELGTNFADAVAENDFKGAKTYLTRIERQLNRLYVLV